ncbi:hypothetical protein [Shewanella glacialipiscicola]|uniref:hypothetical protein n=1 Tax=Shewanella glacialipiscicola TaxID=614069 RepID=UPI003D78D311
MSHLCFKIGVILIFNYSGVLVVRSLYPELIVLPNSKLFYLALIIFCFIKFNFKGYLSVKFFQILIAVFLAYSVIGCTSIPTNARTNVKEFSEPPIGEETAVFIGDNMLYQGKISTANYLHVQKMIDGVAYDIHEGFYKAHGDKDGKFFYSITGSPGAVIQNPFADPAVTLSVNSDKEVCVSTPFVTEAACYEGGTPEEVTRSINSSQDFQQTLIYSGNTGKIINISYREFTGGMARDAFSNNVEYDMSKSNIIRYKGAEIEVLDYDNRSIKFRVIKQFKPTMEYSY